MSTGTVKIDFNKILLGRAKFTIVSKKTGTRFTYEIKKKSESGVLWFISVMTGCDNDNHFSFLGTYKPVFGYIRSSKSSISYESPSNLAIQYLFNHPNTDLIDIFHCGYCMKCGRTLTTPDSIQKGIGPKCDTIRKP